MVFTKLDQVDQVDQVEGGDPDDKGKGEEETSSKNSDTEEEEEINQVIQDQVWGIGIKNQEKHDIHQAKTEGTEHQAKAKDGVKNKGIGDSQLEDKQKEVITERPPRHRVKTKGKEEAARIFRGCKGRVITDKGGKKKKETAKQLGGRRRYDETDFLQVETKGVMRFTQQDRKNLQVFFTKRDQVDQVEGGDPDNKGKGEKETSSKNSDTKEEKEINHIIQDQVWGIGDENQEKYDILQAKTEDVVEYDDRTK